MTWRRTRVNKQTRSITINQLTLSEKYVALALNDKGKLSFLKSHQNGVYITSVLELYENHVFELEGGVKGTVSVNALPDSLAETRALYDFVKAKEGEKFIKVLKAFVGNPLQAQPRKDLVKDVMDSAAKKGIGEDEVQAIVKRMRDQLTKVDDVESMVLIKVLFELHFIKKHFSKDEARELKQLVKSTDQGYSEEIKDMMKLIDSLAVVGGLVGAGVV